MPTSIKIESPFPRLHKLLADITPNEDPINLTIGEPQHAMPDFVGEVLQTHLKEFENYPPILGTEALRQAIANWMGQRYPTLKNQISADEHIIPLNGSREGLFSAMFPAMTRRPETATPKVLIPNPFYQCYVAGALAAGAEPHFLSATKAHGFLPNLEELTEDLLTQTIAMYLCSPSNPEGAVADQAYLKRLNELARAYDFMLFFDECYSEIYFDTPPISILEVSYDTYGDFKNVLSFNSLSKRSNLPGLRSGFVAGDQDFLKSFGTFRAVACPQVPLPIQHVSTKAWSDESHVEDNRKLYREKFLCAKDILGPITDFEIPAGGFFIWLNIKNHGSSESVTQQLWQNIGVKVLPGAYLAQLDQTGTNPAADYIRLALVQDLGTTRLALEKIVRELNLS